MAAKYKSDSDIAESLESIYYQLNTPLKEMLVNAVHQCKELYLKYPVDADRVNKISEVFTEASESLAHRTGIKLFMHVMSLPSVGSRYNVNVSIPKSKVASAVSTKLNDRELGQLISGKFEHLEVVKGTMDLKALKVSGFYSDISFDLNMDIDFFKPDFLDDLEVVAIILHELGHIWDYMYTLGEAARTGAITGATFDVLRGRYDLEKKLSLVKVLSPVLGKDIEDPGTLEDEEIIALVQANSFNRRATVTDSKEYNKYMLEFVADQFAARHGLAYQIATAQRKLEKEKFILFRNGRYQPYWFGGAFLAMDLFSIAMLPYGILKGNGQKAMVNITKQFAYTFLFSWLSISLFSFLGITQVDPKIRLTLVRSDLISLLKDPSLDDLSKRSIIKDLEGLDREIDDLSVDLTSPFSLISEYINTISDMNLRSFKTTVNINQLSNNRLYELAEKLRLNSTT